MSNSHIDNLVNAVTNKISTVVNNHNSSSNAHSSILSNYLQTTDVKDNLTSTDTNKPLSAKQGKELKTLVDGKANSNHSHDIVDLNPITHDGAGIVEEGMDRSSQGIGYGDSKLIYNQEDNMFYYDKNGSVDYDTGNELATMNDIPNISGKEDKSNKVTSISSSSTDTQYPSAKCVYDENNDLWDYVEDLDYTQIGGELSVVDAGIQAIGLEQIINQLITKLMGKSDSNHTHSGYASSSHTHGTWTSQTVATYGTLYINTAIRMCELRYVRSFSSASADTFYEWHTGAIPSAYRPSSQVMGSMNQVGAIYVDSDGDIGGKFAIGWSSSRSVIGTVMWHY